jgi:peptidyl-prolyl cis-trans isomerase D
MIGTIRKHQTWLWAIIITVVIISFVFMFSPYSKMNDTHRRSANYGSINGQRVSEDDFVSAWREVELRYFFMNGRWPDDSDKNDLQGETYKWLLLLQKENQMDIHISSGMAAQTARGMLSQLQRAGVASPEVFQKQVLQPHNLDMEDFERFVRHYLGIQELIATVGLSGRLVTPQEVRALYQREHEELATEAVFFSASNYLAGVSAPPDAVSQFYSNRLAIYRVPDLVRVRYVKFDLTNFYAQAKQELARLTNLDQSIDEAYQRGGTNFLREVKSGSLEEARTRIHDLKFREFEAQGARKKAIEFANPLFDMEPAAAGNFDKLAKENGLVVGTTAPFDRENGPRDMEVGAEFAQKAFKLKPDQPFAGPIMGLNAVYVIALSQQIPSEIPPLDQIRGRVVDDYKFELAKTLARQAGLALYPVLTNGLAQGKTFPALCLSAQVRPVSLPPFSLSLRELPELEDRATLNQLKQAAFSTPPGAVSPFQTTEDGGFLLYVKSKLPLDQAKMDATLPAFANYVRQSRQSEAFNEWFSKQASTGLRDTPVGQPRPAPSLSSGSKTKKS